MAYRYLTVKRQGKTVLLHRWLMSQRLGRDLATAEHVHHINGNPKDNRLENLEVLPCQAHQARHKTKYPKQKKCAVCRDTFTPAPTKRKRALRELRLLQRLRRMAPS